MDRMKQLIEILKEASEAYYMRDQEIMPDIEYDALYDELVELERETGIVLAGSPTQQVGHEVISGLEKVSHSVPMLSLGKTKDIAVLEAFLQDREGVLSWKMDGLAIVLKYEGGSLKQAITRGNGMIGEDVTHNARFFKNVPLKVNYTGEFSLRGEAVISYADFERINEKLEDGEKYKNPRNLCSGAVRQLDSGISAGRSVSYYAYTLIDAVGVDFGDLKTNQLAWLRGMGFETAYSVTSTADSLRGDVAWFAEHIVKNPFASDGLVLTYNSISYSSSLGATSKFPHDSIALKWEDEQRETTLLAVEWNTSRTGLINPIAVFEPIELEGTTVSKASLHNVSILENLRLGIGDVITVYKANMIIPQVAGNLTESGTCVPPTNCPVCGGETTVTQVNEGKALYCTNPTCRAQLISSLSHYTSRNCMNIEGLSEATIEKFIEQGFIKDYTDIYHLKEHEEEIKGMEGFGERSYIKLVEAIERSKDVELYNFLFALGINQVGLANAKLLCRYYQFDLDRIKAASEEELCEIEGFGKVIAHSVHSYFANELNKELLDEALEYLRIKPYVDDSSEKPLDKKIFVITGDLHEFENRKQLQGAIEKLGGKVTGSVTSKTSYLINNDSASNSSKNKKARELGVPVITEKEFIGTWSS